MLAIPLLIFGEYLFGRRIGAIVETEQDIAVRQGEVGTQRQCLPQRRLSVGEPTLAHQGKAEIVVCISVAGRACNCVARCVLRLLRMTG